MSDLVASFQSIIIMGSKHVKKFRNNDTFWIRDLNDLEAKNDLGGIRTHNHLNIIQVRFQLRHEVSVTLNSKQL